MDRNKAQKHIGKMVKINDGDAGVYAGILKEIRTEARKPWKGVVQILVVLDLPTFNPLTNQLPDLKYKHMQVIECTGVKLSPYPEEGISPTFEQSIVLAAQTRSKSLQQDVETYDAKQQAIMSFLRQQGIDVSKADLELYDNQIDDVINYTFHHDGDCYILIDENEERLDLKDCPFTFTWTYKDQSVRGKYEENGTFISESGERYNPKEGSTFSISKEQFDPYMILQNELEPTALLSLEKNLAHYQLTHKDLLECHNSLLTQLLSTDKKTSFKGVNFLTYKGNDELVIVQHHYERELRNYKSDRVYDRFEFTSDKGKRSIVTYSNEYSL
ncbi:DUF2777 family protein [Halalkalibacter krulwichiae]|uniref:Uncharacterized protein n=1 Tax=Halalkalibacter krulwichiae TaxID=199441 RepID=A0A1X9ME15_9BACI|nr:DUF2777 family protein [Halalkalibacter krulwichiae]ARK30373.1 hypothetical protein BkAM31D_11340 [Halalkalibacter krulwichiae]